MSDVVIKAEGLGKKYVIGHQAERERYTALRDVMVRNMRGLWDKTRDLLQGKPVIQGDTQEEIWALKDVDFEIRQGDAAGIIGRNGAGKSTLLKILSRITEPSAGRVTIRGRVASLLEVGTGFHPELTGRENIYLNGAILGMTQAELKRKFDEIVDFSGVEQFLDTPVKRYSSGMYVRLAFAVAAHLDPEILVVDEVLAVGDAAFQEKCLGKMNGITRNGRTVLFVSHNMVAIRQLCSRAILLHAGTMTNEGSVGECIVEYLGNSGEHGSTIISHLERSHPKITIDSVTVNRSAYDALHLPSDLGILTIEFEGVIHEPIRADLEAKLSDIFGTPLAFFSPAQERGTATSRNVGRFHIVGQICLPQGINRGKYLLSLALGNPGVETWVHFPHAVTISCPGSPTLTGKVFDYHNGAGWLHLRSVVQDPLVRSEELQ